MSSETALIEKPSIRDEFLDLARLICLREETTSKPLDELKVSWFPEDPTAFEHGLNLTNVFLNTSSEGNEFEVTNVTFWIGGDEEGEILVSAANSPAVYENPFDKHFLDTFRRVYSTHKHTLCISALSQRRQAEIEAYGERQPQSSFSGYKFTDKRRSATTA
jgi:hypothetical protein